MNPKDIDLREVYTKLDPILGKFSYLLTNLITKITKIDKDHPLADQITTFAVDNSGTLYINEKFCENYITNTDDITTLFIHELFHRLLGDTDEISQLDKTDPEFNIKMMAQNIAMDSRINAFISRTYKHINSEECIRQIYKKFDASEKLDEISINLHKLLYSESLNTTQIASNISKQAAELYIEFYENPRPQAYYSMYCEILQYLRNNRKSSEQEQSEIKIFLLGNHSDSSDSNDENNDSNNDDNKNGESKKLEPIPKEIIDELKSKIIEALKNEALKEKFKSGAGQGNAVIEYVIDRLESVDNKQIDSSLIRKLNVKHITSNILLKSKRKVGKWTESPVMPTKISRTDLIKLAANMPTTLWKAKKYKTIFDPALVPIYFDVSGSMTSYIPTILDLLLNMSERIQHLWCFSDYVVQHNIEELKERKIKSSGGTCFDEVIRHAVKNSFKNLLVITDGDCGVSVCSGPHPEIETVCTLLTENCYNDNWFSLNYKNSYKLKEVVS